VPTALRADLTRPFADYHACTCFILGFITSHLNSLLQVAELAVPCILMHSRGSPADMHNKCHLQYKAVELDVASELKQVADAAMHSGVRMWQIMLDPGIGFSKNELSNLRLIANLDVCRHRIQGAQPACVRD
jgi:dihydropteroate synthase